MTPTGANTYGRSVVTVDGKTGDIGQGLEDIRRALTFAAFTRHTDYMNNNVDDNATWEAWQDEQCALLAEVEALPLTPENARIRAQAIMMIHMGEEYLRHMFDCDPATDGRLAIDIIRTLATEARS